MPNNNDFRLLHALAEELKLPLLQIARLAELEGYSQVQNTSELALKLIDGYVLGLQTSSQLSLHLEPVTLSSVLYDTAESLQPFAKQQGYEIHVETSGKLGPVMGDRTLLQYAFSIIGYELMSSGSEEKNPTITLATYPGKKGIVSGVYTSDTTLSVDTFRRAKALHGTAKQTMPHVTSGNGAGIFIADKLLSNFSSSFKITRHNKQTGLAATLLPSQQLALV